MIVQLSGIKKMVVNKNKSELKFLTSQQYLRGVLCGSGEAQIKAVDDLTSASIKVHQLNV